MSFKSITSYTNDRTSGVRFAGGGATQPGHAADPVRPNPARRSTTRWDTATTCYTNADYLPGIPDTYSYYYYYNRRNQITQEFRFSSKPMRHAAELGGRHLFQRLAHPRARGRALQREQHLADPCAACPRPGSSAITACRASATRPTPWATSTSGRVDVSDREINLNETEIAAFGEANYDVTAEAQGDRRRPGDPLRAEVLPALRRGGGRPAAGRHQRRQPRRLCPEHPGQLADQPGDQPERPAALRAEPGRLPDGHRLPAAVHDPERDREPGLARSSGSPTSSTPTTWSTPTCPRASGPAA